MAENDSNRHNRDNRRKKPNNFWLGLNDTQKDMRVLFFENQQKSRGARADDNYWSGLTDQQKLDREEFFAAQAERREDKPAKMPGSGFWFNTTDEQQADRDAFFAAQAKRRADRPARTAKMPVSNYWFNTSEEQRKLSKEFFDKQAKFRDGLPAKIKGNAASGFWFGTSEDQRKKSKEFHDKQKTAKPVGTGTNKFSDVSVEKRIARSVFFEEQKKKRDFDPLKNLAQKVTPTIKGPKASQWKTNLVFNFHVAVPGIGLFLGDFRRITGLGTDEWDYETYREGGDNGPEHILFNHTKNGRVVFEWAIRHPDPFLIWFLAMGTGVFLKEPIAVTLLEGKSPRAMWIIPMGMIVKIESPELDALASEVATNKVEIVHNGLIPVPMI